ncbi:MAG TPA: agmatine deiminase family protein [Methanomassiliicoccales archaeon]|nr:agmatine deiminase family protein [Methanomassiliicoccales archaeon]
MPKDPTCNCEPAKSITSQTPREAGYRMPAEWARHDATWLSWPKNPLTFPDDHLEKVEAVYAEMVSALSGGERVRILVDDEALESRARHCIDTVGADWNNVIFVRIKSADVWVRDYGPTFLLSNDGSRKALVKWRFNAWGGKYDDLMYDDRAGEDLARAAGLRMFRPGIVLEGGSIDVNGKGTVLTTEQCLLNKNRNPDLSRAGIEAYLEDYIAAPQVIWLKSGIDGDDTDGHVDDFARFASEKVVLCAHSDRDVGTNRQVLDANLRILEEATDGEGNRFEVIRLPMPEPIELPEEERFLPASYANFYIGNKVVLMPAFDDDNDEEALQLLRTCFPGREIVPIQATDLVYGYGGFHCVTQQEPAAERKDDREEQERGRRV